MIGDDEVVEVDLDDTIELDPEGEREVLEKKPEVKAEKQAQVEKTEDVDPEVVARLKQQLVTAETEINIERQNRLRIEQHARKLAEEAQKAKIDANEKDYLLTEGFLNQAKREAEFLKREYKAAMDAGEYEKAAEVSMRMGHVSSRLTDYQDRKEILDERMKKESEQPKIERIINPGDVFEESIKDLSEPSKQWLRQHKECVLDNSSNERVKKADQEARRNGIVPDSREYFQFVEEFMGYRQKPEPIKTTRVEANDEDGIEVVISDPKPVKKPMVSAPVSREAGHQGKAISGKVHLTREEAEMAESMGMSNADYAKWKIKVERDRRYAN